MKIAKLKYYKTEWYNLKSKIIANENIAVYNFGDIHPFENGPVFKNAKKLFVIDCNKNFVYYWINKSTFPNVTDLYLDSHPCDASVFKRKFNNIYVSDNYSSYTDRWSNNSGNLYIFEDIKEYLSNYSQEELKFGE